MVSSGAAGAHVGRLGVCAGAPAPALASGAPCGATAVGSEMVLFSYLPPWSSFRAAGGALPGAELSLAVPPAATEPLVCVLAQRQSHAIVLLSCAVHCTLAFSLSLSVYTFRSAICLVPRVYQADQGRRRGWSRPRPRGPSPPIYFRIWTASSTLSRLKRSLRMRCHRPGRQVQSNGWLLQTCTTRRSSARQ